MKRQLGPKLTIPAPASGKAHVLRWHDEDGAHDERIFTIEEAAEILEVSPARVRKLCIDGRLGTVYKSAGALYVAETALVEYHMQRYYRSKLVQLALPTPSVVKAAPEEVP